MQVVGAQWLMGSLTHDVEYLALLQAAVGLPYLLFAVPIGVLGDIKSRRSLLISGQATMALSGAALGVLALTHTATPTNLLVLTAVSGCGQVLVGPAWLALLPGLLPVEDIPAGAALDGVGIAMARVVGPLLGGVVIVALDPAADFFLNAALSLFSVAILFRVGRLAHQRTTDGFRAALRSGLVSVAKSTRLRRLIIAVTTFSALGGAVWALLPNLARIDMHVSAIGYGALLGCAGIGATVSAALLPSLRRERSLHQISALASLAYALACGLLTLRLGFAVAAIGVTVAGGAWVAVVASLDALAQTEVTDQLRARTMSIYEAGFQGGTGIAGAVWGAVATWTGDAATLAIVAVALVVRSAVI